MSSGPVTEELRSALQSATNATMVTCSRDGVPNTTVISQVYCVDDEHVALSFQFFNKTIRNVRANPRVVVALVDMQRMCHWVLQLRYDHSEGSGALFDEMEMQLEAIASATGMSGIFKLRAADVYEVLSVEKRVSSRLPAQAV